VIQAVVTVKIRKSALQFIFITKKVLRSYWEKTDPPFSQNDTHGTKPGKKVIRRRRRRAA